MTTISEARNYLPGTQIEIINPEAPRGRFRNALFDFDGTLSLIREGWQDVMIPMFVRILRETGTDESEEALTAIVKEFVTRLTGKQTIYQMIELASQIEKRGGTPLEPLVYKHQYLDLLWDRIKHRVGGLKDGSIDPGEYVVPGSYELMDGLEARGCDMFLASGTDLPYVVSEAEVLKLDGYFRGHIYGALDEYKNFSKKMIIGKLLRENQLSGPELLTFGDGYVEVENTKEAGGVAVGVASDEAGKTAIDEWKRSRLIMAGADIIIPNFLEHEALLNYLFEA